MPFDRRVFDEKFVHKKVPATSIRMTTDGETRCGGSGVGSRVIEVNRGGQGLSRRVLLSST